MICKILLVDDDALLLDTFSDMLESEGYDVISAVNPYEAIHLIKDEEIDLAILDYNLPYMNGAELGRLVYKSQSKVKIMFISGNDRIQEFLRNVDYDIFEVFSKPVSVEVLRNRIREILGIDCDREVLFGTSKLLKTNRLFDDYHAHVQSIL